MSKRAFLLLPIATLLSVACSLTSLIPGGFAKDQTPGLPVFEQDDDKVVSSVENGDARTLYDRINESDAGEMFEPGTQRYTVDLQPADLVDLSTGWCAKNKTIMDSNEKHVTGSITVDDYVIPDDQLVAFSSEVKPGGSTDYPDGLSCYSWDIVASQWPVGTHTVIESWTLDSALNDGYADYTAGTYGVQYTVIVSE
jgi:hypothetical protein